MLTRGIIEEEKTEGGKEMAVKKTVDEKAVAELGKQITSLEKKLSQYDKKLDLGPMSPVEYQKRLKMQKELEDLKAVVAFEIDFANELIENETSQTKYQEAFQRIQEQLEILSPEAGYSAELIEQAKNAIDDIMYGELGIVDDKDRDDERNANIELVKSRMANLEVRKNTIYGNINEDVFAEDLKKMQELDKAYGVTSEGMLENLQKKEDEKALCDELLRLMVEYETEHRNIEAERKNRFSELEKFKELYNNAVEEEDKKRLSEEIKALEGDIGFSMKRLEELNNGIGAQIETIRKQLKLEPGKVKEHRDKLAKEVESGYQKYWDGIENKNESSELSDKKEKILQEMKEKYGEMDPSKFGSYAEMLEAQRKIIEARKRSYHIQEGWEEEQGEKKVEKPAEDTKKASNPEQLRSDVPSKISQSVGNDGAIALDSDASTDVETGNVEELKKQRKVEAGFLYRIEEKDGEVKLVKEDIEKAGYTKNVIEQLKTELDKFYQEIEALPNGDQKKKMKKIFKSAKKSIRHEKSVTKKLELLLALKLSLNTDEKADFLKRAEKGNVFPKGMSDLNKYYHDETKERFILPNKIELRREEEKLSKVEEKLEIINRSDTMTQEYKNRTRKINPDKTHKQEKDEMDK